MNKFTLFLALAAFSLAKKVDAQTIERQTISSAQMLTAGPDFIVAASVGETARTAAAAGSFFVQQGFEQPSGAVSVATREPRVEVFFRVFPNPTDGLLILELETEKSARLGFSLFDLSGKLIVELEKAAPLEAGFSTKKFDVAGLASGSFALVATDEKGQPIRSILIQKK